MFLLICYRVLFFEKNIMGTLAYTCLWKWKQTLRKDENMLKIFERRILRRIYGSIKENGIWRSRYNHELYKLYNGPDIVKVIKVGQLRSLGHLFRMQEQNPCRTLTLHKPEGTRRVGRPTIWWLDSVDNLKTMGVKIWRRKSQDWDQRWAIINEVKVHDRL